MSMGGTGPFGFIYTLGLAIIGIKGKIDESNDLKESKKHPFNSEFYFDSKGRKRLISNDHIVTQIGDELYDVTAKKTIRNLKDERNTIKRENAIKNNKKEYIYNISNHGPIKGDLYKDVETGKILVNRHTIDCCFWMNLNGYIVRAIPFLNENVLNRMTKVNTSIENNNCYEEMLVSEFIYKFNQQQDKIYKKYNGNFPNELIDTYYFNNERLVLYDKFI